MGGFNFTGDIESVGKQQLEYIGKVLEEKGFKGPDVLIEQVGAAGDNYSTNVKRVIIHENGTTFKMIAKLAHDSQMIRDLGTMGMAFSNEYVIYTKVLPKFRELQESAGVPKEDLFIFPKCYGCNNKEPNESILLEDLKEHNFVLLDRYKPLSNDAIMLILKNLAIFHSLAFVVKLQEPKLFAEFKSQLYDSIPIVHKSEQLQLFYAQIEKDAIALMDDEKYRKILKDTTSKMTFHGLEVAKDNDESYYVVQQGDVWTNNMLFQVEGDKPKSCVLLDYQLAKVSNPVFDVLYMICNSTDHEQRQKHYKEYIKYYHKEMARSLQYFGLDIDSVYPEEQFNADLKRYGKYMLATTVMVCTFTIRKPDEASKFKETIVNNSGDLDPDDIVQGMLVKGEDTSRSLKSIYKGLVDSFLEFGLVQE